MQIDVFPHPVNDNFDMNSFVWHYTDMFVRHGLTIERTKPNVFDRTKWHVTKKGQSMSISEDDKKALVLVLEYFHCTLDDNPDYGIDKLGEAL